MLLLLSIVPSLVLLSYFYNKDSEPEPKRMIAKVFVLGFVLILPALIFESILSKLGLGTYSWYSFVVSGFVEELLKFFVITKFVFDKKAFSNVTDGIVYTIIVSLGFATFENIIYVFRYGYEIALFRSITAVPFHALVSGIMGYFIGKSKFSNNQNKFSYQIQGLLIAIVLHGIYNLLLMLGGYFVYIAVIQILIMWQFLFYIWKQSKRN